MGRGRGGGGSAYPALDRGGEPHRQDHPLRLAAAVLAVFAALAAPARADSQPDARAVQFTNCALGGAAGGASQIATGGTAVSLTVKQPLRGVYVQNPSTATESLFVEIAQAAGGTVNPASTAAGVSVELQPGQSFTEGPGTISGGGLSFNAATSSHAFICKIGQ